MPSAVIKQHCQILTILQMLTKISKIIVSFIVLSLMHIMYNMSFNLNTTRATGHIPYVYALI